MKINNVVVRNTAIVCLIWSALIFHYAVAESRDPQALFLPIDVAQHNAHVEADINVKESRLYVFYLNVHYRNEGERKRVFKLIGGPGRLNNGGGYESPGLTLPVHVKLTDSAGNVLIDSTYQTQGNAGHGLGSNLSGEYLRKIGEYRIKPGIYHFQVEILESEEQFHGLESAITIGTRPHTRPVVD